MIGKIGRFGSNFLGALQYVYFGTKSNRTRDLTTLRGELVFAQHVNLTPVQDNRLKGEPTTRLNIETIADAMQTTAALNNRLRKPVWHQTFAFPPGEQPANVQLSAICESFADTFGLSNNQVVAFRHRDKQHDHIHIIANRVNRTGRTTAQDSQNYRRTAQFCRLMEVEHGLTPTRHLIGEELDGKRRLVKNRVASQQRPVLESGPTELDQLCAAITEAKGVATDVPTFVEQLRQWGYAAVTSERAGPDGKQWVGIAYGKTFAGGTERWVSGSTLGPAFTHRALLAFFAQKQAPVIAAPGSDATISPTANAVETTPLKPTGPVLSDEVRLRINP